MDRSDLSRAMGDASRPSKPRETSVTVSDLTERLRMFVKLFTLCPLSGTQDTEGSVLAYIDETKDIPPLWISIALKKLTGESDRKFAPSVGEIRGAALVAIRAQRRRSEGKPEVMLGPYGESPLRPERELAWARLSEARLLGP